MTGAQTVTEFLAETPSCTACRARDYSFQYVHLDGYPACVEHNCWPCGPSCRMETVGEQEYIEVTCNRCGFKMPPCRVESKRRETWTAP